MVTKWTRKRIREQEIKNHSNPSQFLKRVKDESLQAIKDLTLIAKNLEQKHQEEIFTDETLGPLLRAILYSKSKRVLKITELLSHLAFQKLMTTLPNDIANEFKHDIVKTRSFARLLVAYSDKPLLKQSKK